MISTKRTVAILLPVFSLLLHLFAVVFYAANHQEYRLPIDWDVDFYVLMGISACVTLGMHIMKRPLFRWPFTIVRVVVFLLVGIPFGSFLDVEYILLFSVLMDVGLLFTRTAGITISVLLLGLSVGLQTQLSIYSVYRPAPSVIDLILYILIGLSISFLAIFLREAIERIENSRRRISDLNRVVYRLMGANKGYLEYASKIERETTENERTRIIQELHDIVGKAFTNIFAMMDASLKHPPDSAEDDAELHSWVRNQAQAGLSETRTVLYRLREIQDANVVGIEAIQNLVQTFAKATQVTVSVSWGNLPWRINTHADNVVYSSVQEALVNSFRHGKASKINIQFWIDERSLLLDIVDNGSGSVGDGKGIGQSAMERRLTEIGGSVKFSSSKDGYRVSIKLPKEVL